MSETANQIRDASFDLHDAGDELADRVEKIADQVGIARTRLEKHWRRVEDAIVDFGKSAERPTSNIGRALEDLAIEARRSYDRITGRKRPSRLFSRWR